MAGMNLNPYNLNNRNGNDARGPEAVRAFSNHYANQNKIDLTEESEEEKERRNIRNKYFGAYSFKNTDPKIMDLDKPKEETKDKKDYSLYFIGAGIVLLIIILMFIFL